MVKSGEADWAMDIGFENRHQVPAFKISGTTEVFALVPDVMWHPELKKKKVRQALMHGFDCQTLVKALYEGLVECMSNISVKGTVGINDRNYAPYKYDPDLARRLLKEANYDPTNVINMYILANRVYRDMEWAEAVANYWKEVGINAKVVAVEQSRHATIRSSGCGRFNKEAGYTQALDCAQRKPPQPHLDTSHLFSTGTSNEMLDMQVQSQRRLTCFNISSRVCYPEFQKKIDAAAATPEGPGRTRLMEEIGDAVHDEVYFISFFPIQLVYAIAKDLAWEPLYAPRLRVNTMRWTK
jgi:peptide/nickel transport system substrate-binding protein